MWPEEALLGRGTNKCRIRGWTNASPSPKSNHPMAKTGLTMRHLPICGPFWPRVRGWQVSCVTGKGQRCVLQNKQSANSKPQPAQQESLCFLWSVPHHNTAALQNRTHFPKCLELYDLTEQSNSTLTKTEQTESLANSVWQASGMHSEEEYFSGNFIPNGL